jgi:DNA transposition AAA+ family ATPase
MMKLERKQQIARDLAAFLKDRDMSQADAQRAIGVRAEYLVTILKENSNFQYDAGNKQGNIPDKWFIMIEDYLGTSAAKRFWKVVGTTQTRSVLAHLQDAKEHGYTRWIIGETGSGKTHSTALFANKSPKDTFIVKVGSTDTIADLLDKVLATLKIPQAKTKSLKIRHIIKKMMSLKYEGLKPILIFDESEYMKQATLANTKELHDDLNGHCGLVLIGTDQLLDNMDRLVKKNKSGMPQLWRRVKFGVRRLNPIDTSFKLFFEELNITDKALKKFLTMNCDNYGELHDALVPCLRESERTGNDLTEEFARTVLNLPKPVR